jgi:hypothetical protein
MSDKTISPVGFKVFRNPHGDVDAWIAAHLKNWWFGDIERMGPQKLHLYGVVRRGCRIIRTQSIEVTANRVTVTYFKKKKKDADI